MTTTTPRRPAPYVGLTLWHPSDMRRVLTPAMRDLLADARPPVVCVHAGPERLLGTAARVVADVRALVPGVRIHLGLGCDYWMGRATVGKTSIATAVARIADGADLAVGLGAEAVVFDVEGQSKIDSLVASQIAEAVIDQARAEHPALLLGHTAYDHPSMHKDDADGDYRDDARRGEYAWRVWCGGLRRARRPERYPGVDYAVPQIYCAPKTGMAPKGALASRLARHRASWDAAVKAGWIRADLPRDAYHQGHHTPFAQLATVGTEHPGVLLWCGPEIGADGRLDESGAWALRGLCAMERVGIRTPAALREYQAQTSLVPDGVAGRRTLASLDVHVPAGVR